MNFVLASTAHGLMIVPRLDYGPGFPGVGGQLLDVGSFDAEEVSLCIELLRIRRRHHGDGVIAVDGGANIGTHTLSMARAMQGWGSVVAIEAQRLLYYALCGNIVLNDLANACAMHRLLGNRDGPTLIPEPDYSKPGSYGSVEMHGGKAEDIGQGIETKAPVRASTLDSLQLARVDFIKLDVEGMELAALEGGGATIGAYRPILLVERIKCDEHILRGWLTSRGYELRQVHLSYLAVHESDPALGHIFT